MTRRGMFPSEAELRWLQGEHRKFFGLPEPPPEPKEPTPPPPGGSPRWRADQQREYERLVSLKQSTLEGRAQQIRIARAVGLPIEEAHRLAGPDEELMRVEARIIISQLAEAEGQRPEPKQRRQRRPATSVSELNTEIRAETADLARRGSGSE